MMRSYDDIDLSQHRPSRVGRVVLLVSTVGALLIAAWVFAPILAASYTAVTAHLFGGAKPAPAAQEQPAAPALASAQGTPVAAPAPPSESAAPPPPVTTAAAAADQASLPEASPAPATAIVAAAAPAAVDTTASTTSSAPPWPQNRGTQAAGPAVPPAPAANADAMELASATPADTPAEPFAKVPLPRKRPSRLIAASIAIPLPRPRPEIEAEAPAAPSVFDLQVERMR